MSHLDTPPPDSIDRSEPFDEKRSMRSHSTRRQRRRAERMSRATMRLNVTPMIDLLLQLLVYFMVAAAFAVNEEFYKVDLPRRTMTSAAADESPTNAPSPEPARDPFELDREPIRVLVTTTGPNPEDCTIEIVGIAERIGTFEALRAILHSRLVDPSLRSGMFLPEHPVVLEPSPATSWEHAVEAFNAAVRAGYVNVIFQTLDA